MRYDDRLATVLALPCGAQCCAYSFRQLIDLLGTMPHDASDAIVDDAYMRLGAMGAEIPAIDRARILGQGAPVALAAPDGRAVHGRARRGRRRRARAPIWPKRARPDPRPADPRARPVARQGGYAPAARALLARLGIAERALPPAKAQEAVETPPEPEPAPKPRANPRAMAQPAPRLPPWRREGHPSAPSSAGSRPSAAPVPARTSAGPAEAPLLPLGEEVAAPPPLAAFDFLSDAEGRVTWAEAYVGDTGPSGAVGPMVVGHLLAGEPSLALAIRQHQPFRAPCLIEGAHAVAGPWRVDGVPRFDPASGRFGPYGPHAPPAPRGRPQTSGEGDRLRQVLHELRTPVNAIQGFAEIIQQQLFGPTRMNIARWPPRLPPISPHAGRVRGAGALCPARQRRD
jgi:hypothetical protein